MIEHIKEIRDKLRESYEAFVKKHGVLNKTRNKNIILNDAYGFKILCSVETKMGYNNYIPADVLTRSNRSTLEKFRTDNAIEALGYVLSKWGKVKMSEISEITDKDEGEVINELGDQIYWNPIIKEWQSANHWLSGNVYTKMCQTKEILDVLTQEQVPEAEEEMPDYKSSTKLEYRHPRPWRKGK